MLHIAICDDENYYLKKIEQHLSAYLDKHQIERHIHKFFSGTQLLKCGESIKQYHIIFLDINMKEIDGIETAIRIRALSPDIFIVFITSFIEYSRKGYEAEALRYIMKNDMEGPLNECMNCILKKMKIKTEKMGFLFNEGYTEIFIDNIIYIESDRHLLNFYMINSHSEVYHIYDKLDNMEKKLEGHGFLRIRKSQLVNMNHIINIKFYKVKIKTNMILTIPKERYRNVQEEFSLYQGRRK